MVGKNGEMGWCKRRVASHCDSVTSCCSSPYHRGEKVITVIETGVCVSHYIPGICSCLPSQESVHAFHTLLLKYIFSFFWYLNFSAMGIYEPKKKVGNINILPAFDIDLNLTVVSTGSLVEGGTRLPMRSTLKWFTLFCECVQYSSPRIVNLHGVPRGVAVLLLCHIPYVTPCKSEWG